MSRPERPGSLDLGNGRYVLQRRLGAGGMGIVYRALDQKLGTVVALKTLRDVDADAIVRFKREFRLLADVTHRNVITLYDLVSDEHELFFTMELVDGVRLLDWIRGVAAVEPSPPSETTAEDDATRRGRRSSPGDASANRSRPPAAALAGDSGFARLRASLRELAQGVAAIHGAGILHRDLKPSNVLVDPKGVVKILDFGLVTELAREQRREQRLAGTAAYMSPEQCARRPLSPASDWYSVGVMLYEALTGQLPFAGAASAVMADKQSLDPPPPRTLVPDAPADLDALCVELLRRDPEARPAAHDLLRRLGAASEPRLNTPAVAGSGAASLFGRERELAALDDAFAAARAGQTIAAFVHGSSGMGKSAVVRAFVDRVEDSGAVVLAGRCYERESVPYKGVDAVIDALSQFLGGLDAADAAALLPRDVAALARQFPALRHVDVIAAAPRPSRDTTDAQAWRRRAFGALRELLARICDRRPVVLAIDDLQWGDVDSAALLAALLRPPDAPTLLFVAVHRSEDADSALVRGLRDELSRDRVAVRDIAVGALETRDAERLARTLIAAGDDATAQAARIAQESAGNPFFVHELARHLRDSAGGGAPAPISLDEMLRARLRRLPPTASRLLAAIAVAGRPIALGVAQRASDVATPEALQLLTAANLLRTRGPSEARAVECYHDRIREAAVELLDDEQLRLTHLRIAVALETATADPETLALHYRAAGDDERAAEFAAAAARRAADALAFDRAARLYRLALELRARVDGQSQALRIGLADALADAGRGAEAAAAYLAASRQASSATDAVELQRRAAMQYLVSGHFPDGMATLEKVVAAVGLALPRSSAAAIGQLLVGRARIRLRGLAYRERDPRQIDELALIRIDVADTVATGLSVVDGLRALSFHPRHLVWALDAGDPRRIARALAAEIWFLVTTNANGVARAEHVFGLLEELVRRLDTPEAQAMLEAMRGLILFQRSRLPEALAAATAATGLFRERCAGRTWEANTTELFMIVCHRLLGDLRAVAQLTPAVVRAARERGDLYAETNVLSAVGHLEGLIADDPASARAAFDLALERWPARDQVHVQHFNAVVGHLVVDSYVGDVDAARLRVEEWGPKFARARMLRVGPLRVSWLWQRSRVAVMLALRGRPAFARAVAADAGRLLREGTAYARVLGTLCAAEAAELGGDQARASSLLAEAERGFGVQHMRLHRACVERSREQCGDGSAGARQADAYFAEQGVVAPERLSAIVTPLWCSDALQTSPRRRST